MSSLIPVKITEKLIEPQNNIAVARPNSVTLNLWMPFCLQNVLLPSAMTEKHGECGLTCEKNKIHENRSWDS